MQLSIIIPIYKVEKYIAECLHSILDQDNCGISYEIIAINDGSPDKSGEIAEGILSQSGIPYTLINQTNQGLSAARNTGLDKAKGEYIWFVDSDDWIAENSFYTLKEYLQKGLDAITINAANSINGEKDTRLDLSKIERTTLTGKEYILSGKMSYCAPFTIYRREFLLGNKLKFMPGVYHEDNEFTPRAYYKLDKISATNEVLYLVRINPESITRSKNFKKNFDLLTVAKSLDDFYQKEVTEPNLKKYFSGMISLALNSSLLSTSSMDNETLNRFKKYVILNKNLFRHFLKSGNLKYKVEGILFNIFPSKICQIYNFLNILYR